MPIMRAYSFRIQRLILALCYDGRQRRVVKSGNAFPARSGALTDVDVMTILYTSDMTGHPKGASLRRALFTPVGETSSQGGDKCSAKWSYGIPQTAFLP
jgi:long-subunit acyl-CoA synthetase (AMP-forming)